MSDELLTRENLRDALRSSSEPFELVDQIQKSHGPDLHVSILAVLGKPFVLILLRRIANLFLVYCKSSASNVLIYIAIFLVDLNKIY